MDDSLEERFGNEGCNCYEKVEVVTCVQSLQITPTILPHRVRFKEQEVKSAYASLKERTPNVKLKHVPPNHKYEFLGPRYLKRGRFEVGTRPASLLNLNFEIPLEKV